MESELIQARIDLHVHTRHSFDSQIRVEDLVRMAGELKVPLVAITDHDSVAGCRELVERWPGLPLLPGIEISLAEGDFLFFCLDIDQLESIEHQNLSSIQEFAPRDDIALIWAHPLSHRFGDAGGPFSSGDALKQVMERIDGIEVLNGKMLTHVVLGFEPRNYADRLHRLAEEHQRAGVGGSDCHQHFRFMKCWTEVPAEYASPEGVIRAIKERLTVPESDSLHYDQLASYASR